MKDACPRAECRGVGIKGWYCFACGRKLGYYLGDGLRLVHGYVSLGERHGLPAFGPHDSIRLRGKPDSRGLVPSDRDDTLRYLATAGKPDPASRGKPDVLLRGVSAIIHPPVFVYCLGRECNRGQHLEWPRRV